MNLEIPCKYAEFDAHIESALGFYVYVLKDKGTIFYVGKGGGAGAGNARVLSHLEEAQKLYHRKSTIRLSRKIEQIHKVWAEGRQVEWEIIRRALPDSKTAFEVEAAIIDLIGRENLTNAQAGHDAPTSGRISSQDVYRLAAHSVNPANDYKKVLIFNIEKSINEGKSAYEATRKWWPRTKKHEDATHAVGLVRGISYCVVEIHRWQSWDEDLSPRNDCGYPIDYTGQDWEKDKLRRGFEGKVFTEHGSHELLNKNFSLIRDEEKRFWGYGRWLAVEFQEGKWKFLNPKRTRRF